MRFVATPVAVGCRILWAVVDRFLIDGVVEGTATVAQWAGGVVSRLQSGDAQWYGALIAIRRRTDARRLDLVGEVSGVLQFDLLIVTPALAALVCAVSGRIIPGLPKWVARLRWSFRACCLPRSRRRGSCRAPVSRAHSSAVSHRCGRPSLDGLSTPLMMLTVFIGLAAVVVSWDVKDRPGAFFALLLTLQTALTMVFLADNLILFYVGWESVLVPMYFIIGGWGSSNRRHAATKYLLYSFAAGAIMLFGVILAIAESGGSVSIAEISARSARDVIAGARLLAVHHRVPGQDPGGAVPHLAARRTHRGADGGLDRARRRAAQDGRLRPDAHRRTVRTVCLRSGACRL